MTDLYDPLTYENLMLGLTSRFQNLTLTPLNAKSDIQRIEGPGIYSLHYGGDFAPYEPIAAQQGRPIPACRQARLSACRERFKPTARKALAALTI